MKKYKIIDNEEDCISHWTATEVLAEINRERSDEWTAYDESDDLVEAFKHWVEPEERYQMLGEYIPLPPDSPLRRKRKR